VRVKAVTTEHQRHQTYAPIVWATTGVSRAPILAATRVSAIFGSDRVDGVELLNLDTRVRQLVQCDTVIFTADWIPDNELATQAGLAIDPGTKGPRVDEAFRTSTPGIFAVGNTLRGAERADVAALEGRRSAVSIAAWLYRGSGWDNKPVPIEVADPLAWVFPSSISNASNSQLAQQLLSFRVRRFVKSAPVNVWQGERMLWSGLPNSGWQQILGERVPGYLRSQWLIPGQSIRLPAKWIADVDLTQGPIHINIGES
jgi:Pyridine nucleotide-disulphide oxidoreductase